MSTLRTPYAFTAPVTNSSDDVLGAVDSVISTLQAFPGLVEKAERAAGMPSTSSRVITPQPAATASARRRSLQRSAARLQSELVAWREAVSSPDANSVAPIATTRSNNRHVAPAPPNGGVRASGGMHSSSSSRAPPHAATGARPVPLQTAGNGGVGMVAYAPAAGSSRARCVPVTAQPADTASEVHAALQQTSLMLAGGHTVASSPRSASPSGAGPGAAPRSRSASASASASGSPRDKRPTAVALPGAAGRLKAAFRKYDGDRDGLVTYEEFRHGLYSLGVEFPATQLWAVLHEFDPRHTGTVDYRSFARRFGPARPKAKDTRVAPCAVAARKEDSRLVNRVLDRLHQHGCDVPNVLRRLQRMKHAEHRDEADGVQLSDIRKAFAALGVRVTHAELASIGRQGLGQHLQLAAQTASATTSTQAPLLSPRFRARFSTPAQVPPPASIPMSAVARALTSTPETGRTNAAVHPPRRAAACPPEAPQPRRSSKKRVVSHPDALAGGVTRWVGKASNAPTTSAASPPHTEACGAGVAGGAKEASAAAMPIQRESHPRINPDTTKVLSPVAAPPLPPQPRYATEPTKRLFCTPRRVKPELERTKLW